MRCLWTAHRTTPRDRELIPKMFVVTVSASTCDHLRFGTSEGKNQRRTTRKIV